jgi:DNA-binding transcriptional LysR family regulator
MLPVSVRCLQVFATVAEAGSFVAAADRLQISQPSVSDHVHKLERHLGQRLFDRRRGRPAMLTVAGHGLLSDVQALLANADRLHEHSAARRRQGDREVVLSCHRPLAQSVLPGHLAAFAAGHTECALSLHTGTVDEAVQRVRDGVADLGVFLARTPPADLAVRLLGHETFVIVAGPTHALAQGPQPSRVTLAQHPFVRASHHSSYADDIDAMLAEVGIGLRPAAARASEVNTVLQMVEAGVGLLCAIARAVQPQLDAGRLVCVSSGQLPLRMPVWAARARQAATRPTVDALADCLSTAWCPAPGDAHLNAADLAGHIRTLTSPGHRLMS